jgi:hypothetical protein
MATITEPAVRATFAPRRSKVVRVGWAEATLTRAEELRAQAALALATPRPAGQCDELVGAIAEHLDAAVEAAEQAGTWQRRALRVVGAGDGPLLERSRTNLDAAQAQLLNLVSPHYLLGQMPSLLKHVRCHLVPGDPRRLTFERLAQKVGVEAVEPVAEPAEADRVWQERLGTLDRERNVVVATTRAASSAALREQLRLRSFRSVVVIATLAMTLLAVAVAVIGYQNRTLMPLCFAPEEQGQAQVVCPTAQSEWFPTAPTEAGPPPVPDVDDYVASTATAWDLAVVLLVGLMAAALAAATSIRGLRGSSERQSIPVALALLKLPTGAMTAFLGVLLMRGQFVPGLSALDTSAQILAWAIVFGYAQQLFTRLIDRQGQTVLNSVNGADNARPQTPP